MSAARPGPPLKSLGLSRFHLNFHQWLPIKGQVLIWDSEAARLALADRAVTMPRRLAAVSFSLGASQERGFQSVWTPEGLL